jgi:hypothetical protein
MVRMGVLRKAGGVGLLGREKSLLVLGDLIKPTKCFCARFAHAQYYK